MFEYFIAIFDRRPIIFLMEAIEGAIEIIFCNFILRWNFRDVTVAISCCGGLTFGGTGFGTGFAVAVVGLAAELPAPVCSFVGLVQQVFGF